MIKKKTSNLLTLRSSYIICWGIKLYQCELQHSMVLVLKSSENMTPNNKDIVYLLNTFRYYEFIELSICLLYGICL